MKQRLSLASLLLALMAYGCVPDSGAPASSATTANPLPATARATSPSLASTPAPSPTAAVRPAPTTPSNLMEPGLSQLMDEVMRNLSERLGVPVDQITILEVESVMWSDASLGCPRPGMMYARVVTEGYRITLEAEGESYEYHTDQRGFYVLCEDGEPVRAAPNGPETPMTKDQVDQAKADLAGRLDIDPQDIEVVSVEEVTWRDGSLGCPEPGRAYTQALVNGSRIVLEADGRQWHYHSGGGRAPFLCLTPQEPLESGSEPGNGAGDY